MPPRAPEATSKTLLARAALAGSVAAAFAAVAVVLGTGALPCLFARVTHVPCPACGSTRAVYALLRGDLDGVFRGNPLGLVAAALFGVFAVHAVHVALRDGSLARAGTGRLARLVLAALAVVAVAEVALWLARFAGLFGGPVPV